MSSLTRTALSAALATLLAAAPLAGCAGDDPVEEEGGDFLDVPPEPGKEDSLNRRGLWVNTNTRATQVWSARNNWEDTDTAAAREAGIAWGENSGLNWDEKYQLWVAGMERTPSVAGYYDTFIITTPWGKTIESPLLECAELSMFLRISFAAWYELPFFMEAYSSGERVYFGHNGIRTKNGRWKNMPNFGYNYEDYTRSWSAGDEWPQDSRLRTRHLYGTDNQTVLGEGLGFGAFADEIHLNKRVGYFLTYALSWMGSMHLASSHNTYNIVPEAVRAGDVLLARWQRSGIGHTLVVKEVLDTGEGTKDVTLLSGSMPRRQGKWEGGVRSKQYFTSNHAGGVGENSDGEEYAKLGGGLRRYRVTKNINGYWTNTWMSADEAHWINSTDYARIAARPATFETMLGQVSPEQIVTALAGQIDDARRHLSNYPASCAARERRENAFRDLYDVMEREFGRDRASVDAEYRTLADYVFAELEYSVSKTCCWNSTNSTMHDIVMEVAQAEMDRAEAEGTCVTPTVFMNDNGYELWREHAAATGRASAWVAWSEDESCPQRDVASDTEYAHEWTDYCSLPTAGGSGGSGGNSGDSCGDSNEGAQGNNSRGQASALSGTTDGYICDGADDDWFSVATGGTVRISFSHSEGDLDLYAYDAAGAETGRSWSTNDTEEVTVQAGGFVRVEGYNGATGAYSIELL